MKSLLQKTVPATLALAGLLALAAPAQAQPGWAQGPGYGYGAGAYATPGAAYLGAAYGAPAPRGGFAYGNGGYGYRQPWPEPRFHHGWDRRGLGPDSGYRYGYGRDRGPAFDRQGPGPRHW